MVYVFHFSATFSTEVQAQEDSVEPPALTFEEQGWVPPFQVAAFIDREASGDCDRIDTVTVDVLNCGFTGLIQFGVQ